MRASNIYALRKIFPRDRGLQIATKKDLEQAGDVMKRGIKGDFNYRCYVNLHGEVVSINTTFPIGALGFDKDLEAVALRNECKDCTDEERIELENILNKKMQNQKEYQMEQLAQREVQNSLKKMCKNTDEVISFHYTEPAAGSVLLDFSTLKKPHTLENIIYAAAGTDHPNLHFFSGNGQVCSKVSQTHGSKDPRNRENLEIPSGVDIHGKPVYMSRLRQTIELKVPVAEIVGKREEAIESYLSRLPPQQRIKMRVALMRVEHLQFNNALKGIRNASRLEGGVWMHGSQWVDLSRENSTDSAEITDNIKYD